MTVAPVIKKIPGKPARFPNEKDGYVDLSAMSKLELVDLLERENRLLKNKNFICKLPDKGEKIKNFRSKVETELKKREEQDNLCNLISNLSVNESKAALSKLEWTGACDSADDGKMGKDAENAIENEADPLQILATHSSTNVSQKKLLKVEESHTLVKPSDIADVTENNAVNLDVDLYAQHLCRFFDKNKGENTEKKFYPNRSLNKTFKKSTSNHKEPELSSAYVPKHISGQTKLISLEESIIVHQEQLKHLKEIEMNNAVGRLMQKCTVKTKLPKRYTTSYREQDPDNTDDEDSILTEENSEDEYGNEETASNLSDVD
ncbi:DNA-directed RNA polymerase II subunit GRINL1A-like [Planococcus citri]|uniref:DNA-directed RNA polymerase II subunit GRINL1A-like n=1 Tax=Planococcus citri TaxID=170843 RepID=UPI0031F7FAE1